MPIWNFGVEISFTVYNTAETTGPCFQAMKLFIIALCINTLWQLHLDTETFTLSNFFLSLKLYYVLALSLLRSKKIVACPALPATTTTWAMLPIQALGPLPKGRTICGSTGRKCSEPGIQRSGRNRPGSGKNSGKREMTCRESRR